MSVKISLAIPTLMMIASGLVPNLAFASEPEYWTYSEMAALHAEIAPEIAANCGSDPMCKHMHVRNLEGDIYRALELYRRTLRREYEATRQGLVYCSDRNGLFHPRLCLCNRERAR